MFLSFIPVYTASSFLIVNCRMLSHMSRKYRYWNKPYLFKSLIQLFYVIPISDWCFRTCSTVTLNNYSNYNGLRERILRKFSILLERTARIAYLEARQCSPKLLASSNDPHRRLISHLSRLPQSVSLMQHVNKSVQAAVICAAKSLP